MAHAAGGPKDGGGFLPGPSLSIYPPFTLVAIAIVLGIVSCPGRQFSTIPSNPPVEEVWSCPLPVSLSVRPTVCNKPISNKQYQTMLSGSYTVKHIVFLVPQCSQMQHSSQHKGMSLLYPRVHQSISNRTTKLLSSFPIYAACLRAQIPQNWWPTVFLRLWG